MLVVGSAFIMDFDVFFSKFAKDRNHRMLITHSIIPGVILFIIGGILFYIPLIASGIAYIIHSIIDTFDWGTNLLGIHKKPFGAKLLINKEELDNLEEILKEYRVKKSFFDLKYYHNKFVITTEIIFFVFMSIFLVLFAAEFILLIIGYFLLLAFHLSGYFKLKQIENK